MFGYIYLIYSCFLINFSFTLLTVNEYVADDGDDDDYLGEYQDIGNNTCQSLQTRCFCDELCMNESDCCSDYPLLNNSLLTDGKRHEIVETTCIPSTHKVTDEPSGERKKKDEELQQIYAVADCPLNTPNSLAHRCNRSKEIELHFDNVSINSGYDWSTSVTEHISGLISNTIPFHIKKSDIRVIAPVVSVKTGRVYANIDCAQCHGELKIIPGEDFNDYIRRNLKFYTVKFLCRLSYKDQRICLVSSTLPPSLSRPCGVSVQYYNIPSNVLRHRIKWHEFLAVPEKYLGFEISEEKKEEQTTLKTVESILDVLQVIICIFSALCLCVLLIIHGKTKSLNQRVSNQLIMGLASSILGLLLVYLTLPLVVGQINVSNRCICVTIAILIHYFFLCSFTWMSTFGISLMNTFGGTHIFHLCFSYIKLRLTKSENRKDSLNRTFVSSAMQSMVIQSTKRNSSTSPKAIILFSLLATSLPLCFVIPAVIINEKVYPNECIHEQYLAKLLGNEVDESVCTISQWILSYLTPGFCPPKDCTRPWFTVHEAFVLWFLAPTTFLLVFNCIVIIVVGIHVWFLSENELNVSPNDKNQAENSDFHKQSRKMLRICFKLSIILGVVWIFQILASLLPYVPLIGRVASLVSSSQGAALTFVSLGSRKSKPAVTTCDWTSIFTVSGGTSCGSSQRGINWIKPRIFKNSSSEKPDINLQSTNCEDC